MCVCVRARAPACECMPHEGSVNAVLRIYTGVAAILAGGQTLHSLAGCGVPRCDTACVCVCCAPACGVRERACLCVCVCVCVCALADENAFCGVRNTAP